MAQVKRVSGPSASIERWNNALGDIIARHFCCSIVLGGYESRRSIANV